MKSLRVLFVNVCIDFQTFFSSTFKRSIFSNRAPFKCFMFVENNSIEKSKFLLHPSLSRQSERTKMFVVFVLFLWSTSYFSVTRDLRTPNKVPTKQFSFVEEDSVEKLSVLIHASYSCQSENGKKCCSYCFRSLINLVCLRHYIFEFLKRDLKWKQYHCRGIMKWQLVDFVPCIRILIVPLLRRKTI